MSRHFRMLVAFFVVIFCLKSVSVTLGSVENSDSVNVNVFVISLGGVTASEVGNMSRVIQGVSWAAMTNRIRYWTHEWESASIPAFAEVPINVTVTVITDWMAYKILVEYVSNIIIINAHGETVPIPKSYTEEGWVDKIADAMLHRNVTWAHIAGYPFNYYWHQEAGLGNWGEEGFKQLMLHIGKDNVTCYPLGSEWEQISIHWPFGDTTDFPELSKVFRALWGYPLNGSDFEGYFVSPPLYDNDYYPPGAVIKFAEDSETQDFGFYVHYGAGQTYDSGRRETDRDTWGAYAVAAMSIRAYAMKVAALKALNNAEAAIAQAQSEGRTEGLNKAVASLQEAQDHYISKIYDEAIYESNRAVTATNEAIGFLDVYGIPL